MTDDRKSRTPLWLGAAAVAMFGFGFALVPLYDVLCSALGISRETLNTQAEYTAESAAPDTSRTVRVLFLANNSGTMPWEFRPNTFELVVNPGAQNGTTYHARNPSPRDMVAQAIPSISPPEAAQYFHKTECFCFEQQPLQSGQAIEMPVRFVVDKALPRRFHTITLSYTLFDVTAGGSAARVATAN